MVRVLLYLVGYEFNFEIKSKIKAISSFFSEKQFKRIFKIWFKILSIAIKKFKLSSVSLNQFIGIGIISLFAIVSNFVPISKRSKLNNLCVEWGYIFNRLRSEKKKNELYEKFINSYFKAINKVEKKIINLGIKENFKFRRASVYCGNLEKLN